VEEREPHVDQPAPPTADPVTGSGPAFWMLGQNIDHVGWPHCGEIDVMENFGKDPTVVHGTVHGPGYSGAAGITASYDAGVNLADEFHVYAVVWDAARIRWYLDDQLYATVTPGDLGGNAWVFDHEFFLLLNVAVGGRFSVTPDSSVSFPQTMFIDYIRVYRHRSAAERLGPEATPRHEGGHGEIGQVAHEVHLVSAKAREHRADHQQPDSDSSERHQDRRDVERGRQDQARRGDELESSDGLEGTGAEVFDPSRSRVHTGDLLLGYEQLGAADQHDNGQHSGHDPQSDVHVFS
jgi:beta-glucanase (GH16 family)